MMTELEAEGAQGSMGCFGGQRIEPPAHAAGGTAHPLPAHTLPQASVASGLGVSGDCWSVAGRCHQVPGRVEQVCGSLRGSWSLAFLSARCALLLLPCLEAHAVRGVLSSRRGPPPAFTPTGCRPSIMAKHDHLRKQTASVCCACAGIWVAV